MANTVQENRYDVIVDKLDQILSWCNEFDEFNYRIYCFLHDKFNYDVENEY